MSKTLSTLPLLYASYQSGYSGFLAGMKDAFSRFSTCFLNSVGDNGNLTPADPGPYWKLKVSLDDSEKLNPDFSLSGTIDLQTPDGPWQLKFKFYISYFLQYTIAVENPPMETIYYDWYDNIQPQFRNLSMVNNRDINELNIENMNNILNCFMVFFPPAIPNKLDNFLKKPHSMA